MYTNKMTILKSFIAILAAAFVFVACDDDEFDDEVFNASDLRVLKVEVNGERLDTAASEETVITSLEITFSAALDQTVFENAISISPEVDLSFSYDSTGSIVTITPAVRFAYDSDYTITLPQGAYGANGESIKADFVYNLSTAAFVAPEITLSQDRQDFFEGETLTITASIPVQIFDDITFDLVFGGTAESGVDYTTTATSITIPAGETSASFEITAIGGDALEGEENIQITLSNVTNGSIGASSSLDIALADSPPKLELRGVMELDNYIDGSGGRVRAIQLKVMEDIPDLSIYHIQIATNGAAPDVNDVDFAFPAQAASAGDNLFVVRDADAANAAAYFGACYNDFTEFQSGSITHNGDDAILLYQENVVIESFGEPGVDGTGRFWEYTDSWAYKSGRKWEYPGTGCVVNATGTATNETIDCKYPFCVPVQLQGVSALLWDGSGTNGGKFVQVRVNREVPDMSIYGVGVTNNGLGTDGVEFTFPAVAANEGDNFLIAREPETIATFLGTCFDDFADVYQSDAMNQNGDDGVELFENGAVIETYGDADVDGTGQNWEYSGSWAYKIGLWTYGGIDCAAGSVDNQSSPCPYAFCTSD